MMPRKTFVLAVGGPTASGKSSLAMVLADLVSAVGWPAITPDLRIPFPGGASDVLERIAAGCGGQISRLDGVRADYDDGWALARASITEPAMTLRFEGRDRECMKM